MSEIIVGSAIRYMLLTKYQDGSVDFRGTTLHEICTLVLRVEESFAKDVEDFEQYNGLEIHMLFRGNVLVPEIKIKVGDVEVTP